MCVWVQPHTWLFCNQSFWFTSVIIATDSFLFHLLGVLKRRSLIFSCPSLLLCLSFVWLVYVSVRCLFLIREVGSVASGAERACMSSQISSSFFFFFWQAHSHRLPTQTLKNTEDCLILDSQALNSPPTLPGLHIKTSLMNVLLGQLLRKWRFSSPSIPLLPLSVGRLSLSPPSVHAPFWTRLFDSLRRY